jgi:hypothetical protein
MLQPCSHLIVFAVLLVATGTAHAREWQGNMPKPIGKLPSYPPVVCVTANWTPEPCESRKSSAQADAWADLGEALGKLFAFLDMVDRSWLGTLKDYDDSNGWNGISNRWNGVWPDSTKRMLIYYEGGKPVAKNYVERLYLERGGVIKEHIQRWEELARSGADVEILDDCYSACTLIVAYVAKERLCFGAFATLQFHLASNRETGKPSLDVSLWMLKQYPRDIYDWIMERGGIDGMTVGTFYEMRAPLLWRMGYRQCKHDR